MECEQFGVFAQRLRLRLSYDAPALQDRDFVHHGLDLIQQVRTEEHRHAAALQVVDYVAHELLAHDGVQPEPEVVENHQVGPVRQREQQPEPHVLAFRQVLHARPLRQLPLPHERRGIAVVPAGIERLHEAERLGDRHPAEHALVLGEVADARASASISPRM